MVTFGRNTDNIARVINTTTAEYVREEMNNMLRERVLLDELSKRKRIHKQPGGDSKIWPVKYKLTDLQSMGDMESLNFQRVNRHINATLKPAGYVWTDQMSLWERWQNQGAQAIIRVHEQIVKWGMEDFRDNFGDKLYKDGNASGDRQISGLETAGGYSGEIASTDIPRRFAAPSDTYAGISTALGVKGTWDSSGANGFPKGTGKPGYHFWSPFFPLCRADDTDTGVTGTGWGGATAFWKDNCLIIMKWCAANQMKRRQKLTLWLLTTDAYLDVSNKVEAREQIRVTRGEDMGTYKGGYGPEIFYEGVRITSEYGVPETDAAGNRRLGYGLNTEKMELCHWSPELIYPFPVDFSLETLTNRYAIVSMCQMVFNPQSVVYLIDDDDV